MEDTSKSGMTIKGVPVETRRILASLAANDQKTMAELLVIMVDRERALRATDAVERPATREQEVFPMGKMVSPAGKPTSGRDGDTGLIQLLSVAATLSEACGGKLSAVPGLTALCAERVRYARGLPPLEPRRPTKRSTLPVALAAPAAEHLNGSAQ